MSSFHQVEDGWAGVWCRLKHTEGEVLPAVASQSPQLLKISGIPQETLEFSGITLLKDLLCVGHNLQDHVFFGNPMLCRPIYHVRSLEQS